MYKHAIDLQLFFSLETTTDSKSDIRLHSCRLDDVFICVYLELAYGFDSIATIDGQ